MGDSAARVSHHEQKTSKCFHSAIGVKNFDHPLIFLPLTFKITLAFDFSPLQYTAYVNHPLPSDVALDLVNHGS